MKYLCLHILLCTTLSLSAQEINRVRFIQQDQSIKVYYDLVGDPRASYEVSMYYSTNDGRNFNGPCHEVSGHIGQVSPGYDRQITWDALTEMGPIEVPKFVVKVQARYVPAAEVPEDLVGDFVKVLEGSFTMGSPAKEEGRYDDEKQHQVSLKPFWISRYELTFEEYDAFCAATGKEKPDAEGWGRAKRPVINISWYDAIEYCNWRSQHEGLQAVYSINKSKQDPNNESSYDQLKWTVIPDWSANGYRLPTEAEWEYAARSEGKSFLFGNARNVLDPVQANFNSKEDYKMKASQVGTYRQKTVEVGSLKSPNELGLHDMSGNVYEWCWDWYGSYTSDVSNPKGANSGRSRVNRGGSWSSGPRYCRVAYRDSSWPTDRYSDIGFRLARSL